MLPVISIVVPVYRDAPALDALLAQLQPLRARGHEVIVVGTGADAAVEACCRGRCDRLLHAPRGRARQMNHGARHARGTVLWFVHADTAIPTGADAHITQALRAPGAAWGRFDVRLSGPHPAFRVIERLMNLRSRWSGIATGDQAVFVTRRAFERCGGYPPIELMEDIELSRRLKRIARPCCLRAQVVASSRRWERDGIAATVWLMWRLRLAYFLGRDPAELARRYYPQPQSGS